MALTGVLAVLFLEILISPISLCTQITQYKLSNSDSTTLQQVQVVFRHGDRTPEFPFRDDPNAYESFKPYGWDALDRTGYQRSHEFGKYLRRRYGYLFRDFNLRDIRVMTTDIHRTKISGQLVAAGLFPPPEDMKWGPPGSMGDLWHPIPYQFMPLHADDLLYMNSVPCPAYSAELKRIEEGPIGVSLVETHREVIDAVYENARPASDRYIGEVARFYLTLSIEDSYNLTVPDWVKPYYPDELLSVAKTYFKMIVWSNKMQRLRGGPLLDHVIKEMEVKREGSPIKLWLYSGHDNTLAFLGSAMKVWDDFFPTFCAAIILELHSNAANEYFVKTYFHNDTSTQPIDLIIPGCQKLCPLKKFRRILSDSIPQNYTAECRSGSATVRPTVPVLLTIVALFLYSVSNAGLLIK